MLSKCAYLARLAVAASASASSIASSIAASAARPAPPRLSPSVPREALTRGHINLQINLFQSNLPNELAFRNNDLATMRTIWRRANFGVKAPALL